MAAVEEESEWVATVDQNTGRTYYANLKTMKSSWIKPAGFDGPTVDADDDGVVVGEFEDDIAGFETDGSDNDETDDDLTDDELSSNDDSGPNAFSQSNAMEKGKIFGTISYTTKVPSAKIFTGEEFNRQVEKVLEEIKIEDSDDEDYMPRTPLKTGMFDMQSYAKTHFNRQPRGLLKGKESLMETLCFSSKQIQLPLRKLPKQLEAEAKQAFKNVLCYIGERKSSKEPLAHAQKLLKQGIAAPEEMRDEMYCQIVKQTRKNTNASKMRAWQLMALYCGIFPPSEEFTCYLFDYLFSQDPAIAGGSDEIIAGGDVDEVLNWSQFCLRRLGKTVAVGARLYCPTDFEIEGVEAMRQVRVRVEFLDGSYRSLLVDSQTQVKNVHQSLARGMDVDNEDSFALAVMEEEPPDDAQRDAAHLAALQMRKDDRRPATHKEPIKIPLDAFLDKDYRVLDELARWENTNRALPKKYRKTYRLVFKIRAFLTDELENVKSAQALQLYFVQAAYSVMQGFFPVSEKNAMDLAALQLQGRYGVNEPDFYHKGMIINKMWHYVPKEFRMKRSHEFLEMKILSEHDRYIGLSKVEAQKKYLGLVCKYQSYGCTFFTCMRISRVRSSTDPGEDYVTGVSERGVVLLDPLTKEVKFEYTLAQILTYGFKDQLFLMITGDVMQQRKWHMRSFQGREMHDLIRMYISRLCALQV
eukprot:49002_1